MATAATNSTLSTLFKTVYDNGVEEAVYEARPVTAMLPKKGNVGASYAFDVRYALPQNTSATFSTAQTLSTSKVSGIAQFTVTLADLFAEGTVTNKAIKTSKGAGPKAFAEALKFEFDGTLQNMGNQMETALLRSGYGELGTVSAVATNTVTLSVRSDIKNIEVGMVLVANTAGPTGATRSGTMTVTSVDRGAGTFICSGGVVGSLAANDTVHLSGSTNGSTTEKVVAGIAAWIPVTAPVAGVDSFKGVDRGVDPSRLSGVRIDRSGTAATSIQETCIDLLTEVADNEGSPDVLLVSAKTWATFVKELGTQVVYGRVDVEEKKAKVGFRSIVVAGPKGDVDVVMARSCPDDRIYALTTSSWQLLYAGPELIDLVETSGKTVRQASDPGQAYQFESYAQLICKEPYKNGVAKITPAA